jgi:hypothetical protein
MCGIAGYFSGERKAGTATAVAIAVLAHLMEDRGSQSWGCTDGLSVHRQMGAISKTFTVPTKLPRRFAVHTRYATTGKLKESNSHPFTISGKQFIIGMHNGIIQNHDELNKKHDRTYRVDSQHIFGHIANGIPLDDICGYGTIVYRLEDDWYIGTFNGGELAVSDTREGMFFASTGRALDTALVAAGLQQGSRDLILKDNLIYKLTPQGLYEHMSVKIGWTTQRWNDNKQKKGCEFDLSMYGHGEKELCSQCGDILSFNAIGNTCDECLESSYPDDWELEVIPQGATMHCDDCGAKVEEFEEIAVWGSAKVCKDCLMNYTEGVENEGYSKVVD